MFPVSDIPFYGGSTDPDVLASHKIFINTMIIGFGTREKASQDATQRAWDCFARSDDRTAMRRFNQAWLLDDKNPKAYWGIGILVGLQAPNAAEPMDKLNLSIALLDIAMQTLSNDVNLVVDLAHSHSGKASYLRSIGRDYSEASERALALFEHALTMDPTHPLLHQNWIGHYLAMGQIEAASERLREAQAQGVMIPSEMLEALRRCANSPEDNKTHNKALQAIGDKSPQPER